jgi:bifunctional non-homologous end joining protein LigD
MPRHVEPMKATLAKLPEDDGGWAYEVKLDGVRAITYVERGRVCIESRNLRDVTSHYPELHGIGDTLGHDAVLDGEIVAVDEQGRPRFQILQARMHVAAPPPRLLASTPVAYLVFDLLWLDGESVMDLPYVERRARLEGLGLAGPHWQVPAYHVGDGPQLLEATRTGGLEGLMAKRLESAYVPGRRSRAWLKIKNKASQELVIGGWCGGEGRRAGHLGALMVGHYDDGRLVYAGNVGTGFSNDELDRVGVLLAEREQATCPFDPPPPRRKDAHWVRPDLVAEIEFSEWTREGTLRHPAYKGLRTDKNPRDVVREKKD